MNRRDIESIIHGHPESEITRSGQFEGAGQVYYEIGVKTDSQSVINRLKEAVMNTDWYITVYDDCGAPYIYDHELEEEIGSDVRLKNNLYNQHQR